MKNLITCLVVCVLSGVAVADTWTVDDDGKADFDNIQAAVDAASDGDEIIVMPGTYASTQDGHVVNMLGKAVTLRSTDPSDPDVVAATIIYGGGGGGRRGIACFNGETNKTVIEGLTITNGLGVEFDYDGNGDISWWEVSGGGMYNYESSPTLTNCTFENNTADYGGGMENYSNSNTMLTNCTFTNNTAITGGGMENFYYSSPTLTNCTFTNNSANSSGGGMYNGINSPTLDGCTFEGNSADWYGGGMYNSESSPTLTNCTFTGNSTFNDGGGMYNYNSSSPTLTNCTFTGNSAQDGGGMYNITSSSPTLTDTTVCGNAPDQIYGPYADGGGNNIADVCCPADVTEDGVVDVTDVLALIGAWGSSGPLGDINADGTVNITDMLLLLSSWGPC